MGAQGISERGTRFHPLEFLKMLREVYEKLIADRVSSVDIPIEYEAFIKMLISKRTTIDRDGTVLFRLFDLTILSSSRQSSSKKAFKRQVLHPS